MAEAPAPAARLAALQRDYRAQLPQRLAAIEESWLRLAAGRWEAGSARELLRLVHNLTGSGATFGIAELSAAAREFEQQLQAAIGDRSPLSAEARARIQAALAQVRAVVGRLTATAGP
jgi:HPt (histidine-containing phosphotransfer) domain-containing protein